MSTITLGDVEVTRVLEIDAPDFAPLDHIFPGYDRNVVSGNAEWLVPDHINQEQQLWSACVHTYVVRSAGRTILIDTGFGNGKERPHLPVATHLNTDFLAELAAAGVAPDDVDLVVNTHVHGDHVGWNTTLRDREWIPTFPNATYLLPKLDVDYWNPLGPGYSPSPHGRLTHQNVFEDSVDPIIQAGLATIWDGSEYRIDENLVLESRPGHTPGNSVVWLDSKGDRALFLGDVCHSPLQMADATQASCFDEDGAAASAARKRVLARAVETKTPMFATHFRSGRAINLTADGEQFKFAGWEPFTS